MKIDRFFGIGSASTLCYEANPIPILPLRSRNNPATYRGVIFFLYCQIPIANSYRQTGRNCILFKKELPRVEIDFGGKSFVIFFELLNNTGLTTVLEPLVEV